ncbi:hypothetical protein ACX1DW_01480 [Stutzerimonas sp. KH-1]|jgi:hypothetical protein
MSKPTGKLAFAYQTIAKMEERIEALLAERDQLCSELIEARRLFVRDTDELIAERDALQKDAERYRYLRNEAWGCDKIKRDDMHVVLIGAGVLRSGLTELAEEALDTAIDAALQGEQP